jgi:hypothetical protein
MTTGIHFQQFISVRIVPEGLEPEDAADLQASLGKPPKKSLRDTGLVPIEEQVTKAHLEAWMSANASDVVPPPTATSSSAL